MPEPHARADFDFAEETRVRRTVRGQIFRKYNDAIPPSGNLAGNPYPPLDADAEVLSSTPGGYVYTKLSGTGARVIKAIGTPWTTNTPAYSGVDSFRVEGIVRGSGTLRRFPFRQPSYPAPPACNGLTGIQCVIATGGSQVVTLEIMQQYLALTAVPDSVIVGDLVTFTASTTSSTLQVRTWTWIPDGGGPSYAAAASCGTATSCQIRVYESGVMHVTARVGPGGSIAVEHAQAAVTAEAPTYPPVECPTGETLLDLPAARELMKELRRRTDSLEPQLEWAGYVYRLPDGSYRWDANTAQGSQTCTSSAPIRTLGWEPILVVHSHPGYPDRRICAGQKTAALGPFGGILSPADWEYAHTTYGNQPVVPVVAIDERTMAIARVGAWTGADTMRTADGLLRFYRTPTRAQFNSAYSAFPRAQGGQCIRP